MILHGSSLTILATLLLGLAYHTLTCECFGFMIRQKRRIQSSRNRPRLPSLMVHLHSSDGDKNTAYTDPPLQISSYNETDGSFKGIVSVLTNMVNTVFGQNDSIRRTTTTKTTTDPLPPQTPMELMERIREDYTEKNYLWTGNIDLPSFAPDCRFTDPTLSFIGRDKFVSNVQNLGPIVQALIPPGNCRSDLLSIEITTEYVQSRWNMVGNLTGLPWKPRIDVIGRTKFWFRQAENETDGYQVFFYDECWELPAAKALLQLITPAGTISSVK